ncbi:sucrase/ferredoxin-like family protein [Aspergillus japonicus CBS 114.51]|uniref:Sucrase/ferredoxin-like family protein n=1 Tax=Aspergillus japonicus CBS 114.51 TaxID=1448312 RepID=A0A8T8XCE1_ASPJA|nr:sucrase/ferredoxin-like family protein [Aspergillus japonicus CBS 114.51]RAH85775.1 sucrase/ferredoxin-like family protein [Aspergillus japonicus CBS 114.51]
MQSFIQRGAAFFTPSRSATPADSPKATGDENAAEEELKPAETLFPKVDPAVDGEDCLHDCASCTVKYPAKFDVDQEDNMYGNISEWATHVLVATGKTDWVRDVADEPGSVMEAIEKGGLVPSNGKLKLSASNMPVPDEYHYHEPGQQPTTVLLLPSFTIIDHVTPALAPDLIEHFVSRGPTTTTPLASQPTPSDISELTPLRARPCPHSAIILLCSHRTRDARCGQSAPLLRKEFERHLRHLNLYRDLDDERPGGVGIYFINHVGGHKYAANVIIYRRREWGWHLAGGDITSSSSSADADADADTGAAQAGASVAAGAAAGAEGAAQGIWLARVRPQDCENIIRYTVLQGKVVKPAEQLRGGFDRGTGKTSW